MAANSGLKFTLSAGNDEDDSNNYSPGRVEHSNVWTVSAYDINDVFAISFSNFGNPPIEYGGPGVNILSLWKNGGTNAISGTSMFAPHLAGLLLAASTLDTDGTVRGDLDQDPDPIVVSAVLDVSISGPNSLALGQQGTWTASATGGNGSYSYKWYYRSADTNNQWNGPVSYTNSYSTQMYSFDDYLDLRVDVVAGNGVEGSSIKHVACSDCEPGGGGRPLSVDPNN
ncbi:S8 family serine peptidase [Fodinibius saliphilus]|uniref:S8 family serine peptidase n=1 Tax=Fodinibius saliphilus TaxID=1920650 RepID=UPI001BB2CBDE|nr:S8 family serine peptidase [Fodinibius saliphilus]